MDWEKLKAAFGDDINFANERYILNWAGKSDAFKILQQPTTATLKPAPEESINFDSTENLFIEGENLEVLKVLQKAYYGKVKVVCIDPPYNTGSDSFIYPDRFSEKKEDYLKRIGDKDEEGFLLKEGLFRKNSKDSGHFHSNWLSMMYPRLFFAKNLLRDDGVIFVHIDDNEVHNLRMLMNEIFGEENFVAEIVVNANPEGRVLDRHFSKNHEYIIVYVRDLLKADLTIAKSEEEIEEQYHLKDDFGNYRRLELRNTHRQFGKFNRPNLFFPFYFNPKNKQIKFEKIAGWEEIYPIWDDGFEGCWTWGIDKAKEEIKFLTIEKVNDRWKVFRKAYSKNGEGKVSRRKLKTIWMDNAFNTEKGNDFFDSEFGKRYFSAPKPVELVKECLRFTEPDNIVCDFFSGSGTTAQAVIELNKEDGGNRKFILVQLPELCDEDSEAYKAGYKTIADIAKERIRRVIQKIEKEKAEKPDLFDKSKLDLGFKVFKLSSSSFKIWRGSEIDSEEKLTQQLDAFTNPIRPGAEKQNMLYELMLKAGRELTDSVQYVTLSGVKGSAGTGYYSIKTTNSSLLWMP